jgi:single-stranded-DNA-specific exonuclease
MKRWITPPFDPAVAASLQAVLRIHPRLCEVLAQREVTTLQQARSYFSPDMATLHDPFLMQDMHLAVERLQRAVAHNERILLYGDYDVDGTTSVALMFAFLSTFHRNLDYYIPDRDKEGYGVSLAGVAYAHTTGCKLVVAMDCGIKAHAAVLQARSHGIDFIVCDHHLPEGDLPASVANLDPKRPDCAYPFKELSGCGIAFKLAQAFALANHTPAQELEHLLDLVALSISCDVVPMVGENRTLAHFGLERINRHPRLGLWALIQKSGRRYPLIISDLVFGLGPLINAAGRLADARESVRLLLATDRNAALEAASQLMGRNRTRQEVDLSATSAARARVREEVGWETRKSVVLFDPAWHKGVIGITASRVAEDYHRPTVILTQSEGRAVGSARSIPGFDLYAALQACEELFYSFGGHAHAAGVQMPVEQVGFFAEKFEEVVRNTLSPEAEVPVQEVNGTLDFGDITGQFWRTLQRFAPFGPHNMTPVFVTKNVRDTGQSRLLDNNHVRLSVQQAGSQVTMSGIGFGLGKTFEALRHVPFDIAYTLREEQWRGQTLLSLQVKDLRASSLSE